MIHDSRSKNILFIDTASSEAAVVRLQIGKEEFEQTQTYDRNKAQVILPLIEHLLQEQGLTMQDMTAIEVNVGPGSFTGLRVGVAIANTLAHYLHIPLNNQPVGIVVEPIYS